MAHQVIVLPSAEEDLERLDGEARSRILRRIVWLGEHAERVIHHRLVNMPVELQGLCRLRVGDYRVLYWNDAANATITIYRVKHRREVYGEI